MSFAHALQLAQASEREASLGHLAESKRLLYEAALTCQQVLKLHPTDLPALTLLGFSCLTLGLLKEAAACYRRATALEPGNAGFHQNLGLALMGQSMARQAEEPFRRAIALDASSSALSHSGLASLLLRRGEKAEAAAHFRSAYACEPETVGGRFNLARACYNEDQFDSAVTALRDLIALDPALGEAQRFLAQILQQQGKFEEAEETLTRLLELNPGDGQAYLTLATGRKVVAGDRPLVEQMRSVSAGGGLSLGDDCALHYALGKSLADLREYEAAMKEYNAANAAAATLMLGGKSFDPAKLDKAFQHASSVFTKEFFVRHRRVGSDSEMPIMIVGMMRSGTTLTEQILSCHPSVGAGGELSFWTRDGLVGLDPGQTSIDDSRLRSTQEEYLTLLREKAPGKARVTDKRNSNRYFLGQIHVAFPRAKIIHCMRDPVDNALSIYMTPNSAPVEFAHVKANIVSAYKEYRRLMDHYRCVLPPGTMLDVRYEALVANPEAVTRQMIEFLGLEWNDACLRHDLNPRSVATPSLWQARQPIYTSSVNRWKNYEPWLDEFRELIER